MKSLNLWSRDLGLCRHSFVCAEREPCCREAGYCFDREEKKKIQSNLCSCTRPNIKATHTKAKAPLSVVTADWRVNRPDLYVQICWEQQCGCLGWCHLPLGCPLHFKHNVSLSFIEETSKPVWRTERERVQKKEKVIREKVCVCVFVTHLARCQALQVGVYMPPCGCTRSEAAGRE